MYWDYYLMGIILLPAIILAIYAQAKVSSTYAKYSKVLSKNGMTGAQVARLLLDCADLKNIKITQIGGNLTDHYNPQKQIVALSAWHNDSTSVAALGVAAHEVGHAIQEKNGYVPYKIRKFIIPVTNFLSSMLWPLVVIGLIFNFAAIPGSIVGDVLLWSGVTVFGLATLVDLVTLPVEFNASKRAINTLYKTEILDPSETAGAKKVLNAAALTYVAALLNSLLNLLRFVLVFLMNAKRDE